MSLFRSNYTRSLRELVEACQQQNPRAQVLFYERYKGKLMGVCVRYSKTLAEAEDIFQEGILKIFEKITELQQPQAVDRWVKTIMIRHAIDYYNQETRKQNRYISTETVATDFESDDYANLFSKLSIDVLLSTINELPDGYRIVVNLYFIDGYRHAEIAQLLGISEGTSRSQLARGRQLLIRKLELKGISHHENY